MKKLAAHYLLTNTGLLLKNGIAVLGEDGSVVKFIDTKGELRETQQMIFHSGLLISAFELVKTLPSEVVSFPVNNPVQLQILHLIKGSDHISLAGLINLSRQLQEQLAEMNVPEILDQVLAVLQTKAGYEKKILPGIYLLSGLDLATLRFTPKSRLKKMV